MTYDQGRPQDPPFAIQLEPVEGCSLACSFCGIQSIRDNGANADAGTHGKVSAPYRFMSLSTVEGVASAAADLGWNPRWEFAMHGEPTMHKDLHNLIRAVRLRHPKGYIMVTSNGSGLLGDTPAKVDRLFEAGLNTLALDDYKHAGFVRKVVDALEDAAWLETRNYGVEAIWYYPDDKEGNPHQRDKRSRIVVIADISDNASGTHQLTNQGGNSFAKSDERADQRCAKPFRELSVRWDGNVALCCDDWPGVYQIGNVNNMALDKLWNHPRFEAARRKLYFGQRDFGPCKGCNVRTHRNGLLPDKFGKATMPLPDSTTRQRILEAQPRKVFTIKLTKGD